MRTVSEIVRSLGRKLWLGFLLTCSVSLVSAQTYSPFSGGGMQYSSGISSSAFDGNQAKQQAYSSGRYSGLSGGRTTFDAGYKLSEGAPKSIIDNPYFAEMDRHANDENMQYRAVEIGDPAEEDRLPVGDPILPLLLMLCGYAAWKWRQDKRENAEI